MLVKANISFCGAVTMAKNEVRDIPEGGVINDLLECGYVVPAENSADSKPAVSEAPAEAEEEKHENKRGKSK